MHLNFKTYKLTNGNTVFVIGKTSFSVLAILNMGKGVQKRQI